MDQEKITINRAGPEQFAPMLDLIRGEKFDTSGGTMTPEQLTEGAELYQIEQDGRTVGGFAIRASGKTLWLLAAAMTDRQVDFEHEILPQIERSAEREGLQVAVTTKRPGGIRKLLRQGYEITGITLRKKTTCC